MNKIAVSFYKIPTSGPRKSSYLPLSPESLTFERAMNMEVDDAQKTEQLVMKERDLFKAAENGDSYIFESFSPENLSRAFSLRNEDGRSILHVAAASGYSQVVKVLSSAGLSSAVMANSFYQYLLFTTLLIVLVGFPPDNTWSRYRYCGQVRIHSAWSGCK